MVCAADGVSEDYVILTEVFFDNHQDTIKLMLTHTKVLIKLQSISIFKRCLLL